jgi:hypothetical protein
MHVKYSLMIHAYLLSTNSYLGAVTKKIVTALIGVAVLVASIPAIVYASVPGPVTYMQGVTGTEIALNVNMAKFTATGSGTIPKTPDGFISSASNIIVGYGWANAGTGKALVATIHPTLGPDSTQNPNNWHTHTITVGGGATAPNDFCVVSVDSTPTAGIAISGSTITVTIKQSSLPAGETPATLSTEIGFSVVADVACASGLGVLTYT